MSHAKPSPAASPWPLVKLGSVITPVERAEAPMPGTAYRQVGVKLWGEGAYERETIDGSETKYTLLFRTETGDVILNKIWARNGSVAVIPESLAGTFGSGEFPMFSPNRAKVLPDWIHWLTKTRGFWSQCDAASQGTSGKNRIRLDKFLALEIPLPPLAEQRRLVARLDDLASRIAHARKLREDQYAGLNQMLHRQFTDITVNAPYLPLDSVAPMVRRPILIEAEKQYLELGIRSFGKGTFHKPEISGFSVGNKKLFAIEPGDLLFSNVFAWEGAIAVAKPEDVGRVGSHRYITCLPKPEIATAEFLAFYFVTQEGLLKIQQASPGSAGRNRTLSTTALPKIEVPVPHIGMQRHFSILAGKVTEFKNATQRLAAELDALLPALLDRAFKGEL